MNSREMNRLFFATELLSSIGNSPHFSLINTSGTVNPFQELFQTMTVNERSLWDIGGVQRVATKEFIDSLTHPSLEDIHDKACCVCMEDIQVHDISNVFKLPCSHLFHTDCILPWFGKNHTCPDCRQEFPFEEKSLHTETASSSHPISTPEPVTVILRLRNTVGPPTAIQHQNFSRHIVDIDLEEAIRRSLEES